MEYDPARLPPGSDTSHVTTEIVGHARFEPGGETRTWPVSGSGVSPTSRTDRGSAVELQIPEDATHLEIWFESRGPDGPVGWDSRYGQNYSFAVMAAGLAVPEPAVALRDDALLRPGMIRVIDDAATKETTAVGSSGRRLRTGLFVRAVVAATAIDAWADIHVFDAAAELIHIGQVILQRREESETDTRIFVWEGDVYQGSGGGSGLGVWSRPDAQTLQYRLYCRVKNAAPEPGETVFTDGVLHEFDVPADADAG